MAAVPVVVPGRVKLVRVGADERPIGLQHLVGTEQLVVAGEGCVVRVVGRVAELAGQACIFR
jgi:hypothetical protein